MLLAITTLLFLLLALKVTRFITNYMSIRAKIRHLPGPEDIFLIGNALELKSDPVEFYYKTLEESKTYNIFPVYRVWIGPMPVIVCHRPESVETILTSTKLITKSSVYRYLHPWLGTGLLTSTGDKWRSRRKQLTPAFHFQILRDFQPIMNEQASLLTNILRAQSNQLIDICPLITACSLDIISETVMGVQLRAQSGQNSAYVKAVQRVSEIVMYRYRNPLLDPDIIFYITAAGREFNRCMRILHNFAYSVINQRRKEIAENQAVQEDTGDSQRDASKRKRLAFLDLLIECSNTGNALTDKDIREEVDTFMFEGHDTTSAGMAWALFLLAHHPEKQARVQGELDSIFGDDRERAVTEEDLNQLSYLDCVLKEAQRLYPSVPTFGRYADIDFKICGHTIPRGTEIICLNTGLHRNATIFEKADEFIPERFLKDEAVRISPFQYTPFSAGPRNCIGQKLALIEEKIVLTWILRVFGLESTQEEMDTGPSADMVLRPTKGIWVKLSLRE